MIKCLSDIWCKNVEWLGIIIIIYFTWVKSDPYSTNPAILCCAESEFGHFLCWKSYMHRYIQQEAYLLNNLYKVPWFSFPYHFRHVPDNVANTQQVRWLGSTTPFIDDSNTWKWVRTVFPGHYSQTFGKSLDLQRE